MKKQILSVILAAFTLTGVAQTEKGNRLVGVGIGGLGYSHSGIHGTNTINSSFTQQDNNSFNISINPNVAWFIKDNLAVGGSVSINFKTNKGNFKSEAYTSSGGSTTTTSTDHNSSVYVGPYIRYYFAGSKKGQPFAQLAVQYGLGGGKSNSSSSGTAGSSYENKTKINYDYNAGISLGYELFFNKIIGLYASVEFNYGKQKITGGFTDAPKSIIETTSFKIPVNFGLQVHLPGKKIK